VRGVCNIITTTKSYPKLEHEENDFTAWFEISFWPLTHSIVKRPYVRNTGSESGFKGGWGLGIHFITVLRAEPLSEYLSTEATV